MMEIMKSINVVRGWDGYRLPLHSESVFLPVSSLFFFFFFGFHFHLILPYFVPYHSITQPFHLACGLGWAARVGSINSGLCSRVG